MKRLLFAAILIQSAAVGICRSDDGSTKADDATPFISLTRSPMPESKLPTNTSTLTAQQIEDAGAQNLGDVLDLLPGIDVTRSGSLGSISSFRIRGVPSSDQVQILVDDQPLGGSSIEEIDLSLIPVDNIDHVEVVRGASPVLYGANTIGGVINVITKKAPDHPEATIGIEGRSLQTKIVRGSAGAAQGSVDARISGGGYGTAGYQQNSDAHSRDGDAEIGYRLSNGGRVGGEFFAIDNQLGTPNGTPVPFDQWDGNKELTPNSATQRVAHEIKRGRFKVESPVAGGAAHVVSQTYGSQENYQLLLNAGGDELANFRNRIGGNDTHMFFANGFMLGGSYERDERESLGQATHDIVNWGLYAQQNLTFRKLSLIPAIRFDQHSTFGNQYNPRLTVVYRGSDDWKLSAGAARSFRSPTLVDLYIVSQDPFFPAFDFFGNPNLKPEVAWSYDAGGELRLWQTVRANVTGFYSRIRDRIAAVDTDGNGNTDTLKNASEAELSGVEVSLSGRTGPFSHLASYTFQRARGTTPTSTRFVPLRLTPRHMASYQLTWNVGGGFSVSNTLQYSSRQFQNDGETGVVLAPYGLWDARIEQRIKNVTAYAGVNNITNKLYAESITFGNQVPQPTRTYLGGMSVRFETGGQK